MMFGGLMLCVTVCVCVCVLRVFNVCVLFVNVLNGVVWFACLYYSPCSRARLLFNACALCVVHGVML